MHPDEVAISRALVQRLLAEQFPDWCDLPIRTILPSGTEHAIFRLGDELSVRLPRVNGRLQPGSKELTWLPWLASALPVEVPVPIAEGRPGHGYPWFWEIHTWVPGDTVPVDAIDTVRAAHDLSGLIHCLHGLDPESAPLGRGVPLAERDGQFRYWLERFDGDRRVIDVWEQALRARPWDGPPVWHHGDLDARNWLVRDGRITGVIDWNCMGIGDPACDLMVAWKLHSLTAYNTFRAAAEADEPTWERARGWVVSQAVAILAYYTPDNNPTLFYEAHDWLQLALSSGPG